jgi:hypothetical protein
VLVGLAVVNKSWAVVAVPVVFVTVAAGHRRALWSMGATVASVLLLAKTVRTGGVSAGALGIATGTIFNPPQLFWWFGAHSWIADHARFTIVGTAGALAAVWWARARRWPNAPRDALLLLALVMLLRAALDPWNNLYYHVPFLVALTAYEVRNGRMAVITFLYTFALLIVVPIGGLHMSYDLRAAAYAAVVVPTIGWMAWRLYSGSGNGQGMRVARHAGFSPSPSADGVAAR